MKSAAEVGEVLAELAGPDGSAFWGGISRCRRNLGAGTGPAWGSRRGTVGVCPPRAGA